jgi:hypothetical protein
MRGARLCEDEINFDKDLLFVCQPFIHLVQEQQQVERQQEQRHFQPSD